MIKYNIDKAKKIFDDGVEIINNPFFNFVNYQHYVKIIWNDTNHIVKRHKQYVKDNNVDEYVVTRGLYNPITEKLETVGIRTYKNYTFEQYFRFLIGIDIFHLNKDQLKKFIFRY